MKKMKKLIGVILIAIMVFVMAIPSMAANITIEGTGKTYSAYRLLDATDGGNGKLAYTVNAKYETILKESIKEVLNKESTNIVKDIGALNADETRTFANNVYKKLGTLEAEKTTTNKKFDGVPQGYYLIVETEKDGEFDTISLVMLDTAGNDALTITAKEDYPTLDKEIKHNENGWGTVGDNQIGDTVEYRLVVKVPEWTEEYSTYTYVVYDKLSEGLTSNVVDNSSVKILKHNDESNQLDAYYDVVLKEDDSTDTNDYTFKIVFDLKAAIDAGAVHEGHYLYIYYTATLNEKAVIAKTGNENEAWLEYSNNPYTDSTTDTATDKVHDWTFKFNLNKVDGGNNNASLDGAKFVLAKNTLTPVPTYDDAQTYDLSDTTGLMAFVKDETTSPVTYRVATANEISDPNVAITYVIDAGAATIAGLDDVTTYYLYEVKAPDGYDKLTLPVKIELISTYDTNDGKSSVSMKVDGATNKTGTDLNIVNNAGTELPSTGGIGTTIFYVVGAICVIGVVVLFVTRRCANAAR